MLRWFSSSACFSRALAWQRDGHMGTITTSVNSDLNSRAAGEWTPIDTVQSTAGHSKVSVTTNIYGHAMARSQEQAAQMIEEIMTPLTNELK